MFVSVVLLNFVNVTFLQTYIRHDMGSKAKKKSVEEKKRNRKKANTKKKKEKKK